MKKARSKDEAETVGFLKIYQIATCPCQATKKE